MLHKRTYPLTALKLMTRPVPHHRHAEVQLNSIQMMRQPISPPQISPPVQHMDEPINSMTTLQCSSHVLTTLQCSSHVLTTLQCSSHVLTTLQCSSHVLATDETTEHVSLLHSPSHFLETGEPSNENVPPLETTTFEEHGD